MNKFKMTYGAELELPDVDTTIDLPSNIGKWDMKDFTIVNSNGLANDPYKKYITIGSEVNMTPTDTVDGLINNITELYSLVDTKTNHKSNLHIHVGVDGLAEDYESMHKLIDYTFRYGGYVMSKVDQFPAAITDRMEERLKHLKASHQYEYPKSYQARILAGTTVKEVGDAHQPIRKRDGKRLTHLIRRCGINVRSMFDRGTVEFRHWFGTDSIDQYRDAVEWCELYVDNAIGEQKHPDELLAKKDWNFPKMAQWDEKLQEQWEYTNLDKNKRMVVKQRLTELLNENKINRQHLGCMFG
jgi:hypothetical protein